MDSSRTVSLPPPEIAKKVVRAQRNASPLKKDGVATNYRFVSSEDILIEAREALHPEGLAVSIITWWCEAGRVFFQPMVIDEESGLMWTPEAPSVPIVIHKGMPPDKAEATALTYGLGYWLHKLLAIPRLDAEEPDKRDDRDWVPPGQVPNGRTREGFAGDARRSPNGGGTFAFGPRKGERLVTGSARDLEGYHAIIARFIDDPKKAQYRAKNRAHLAEVETAIAQVKGESRVVQEDPSDGSEEYGDTWTSDDEF